MSTFFRLDSFFGAPQTPLILCAELLDARGEGADEGAVQAVVDYVKRIQSEAFYRPQSFRRPRSRSANSNAIFTRLRREGTHITF